MRHIIIFTDLGEHLGEQRRLARGRRARRVAAPADAADLVDDARAHHRRALVEQLAQPLEPRLDRAVGRRELRVVRRARVALLRDRREQRGLEGRWMAHFSSAAAPL